MKSGAVHVALAAMLLAACAPAIVHNPAVDATGFILFEGRPWRVADAVAIRDGNELRLAFASQPYDRVRWSEDARLDDDDLSLFAGGSQWARSLVLRLAMPEGRYRGHVVRYNAFSDSARFEA